MPGSTDPHGCDANFEACTRVGHYCCGGPKIASLIGLAHVSPPLQPARHPPTSHHGVASRCPAPHGREARVDEGRARPGRFAGSYAHATTMHNSSARVQAKPTACSIRPARAPPVCPRPLNPHTKFSTRSLPAPRIRLRLGSRRSRAHRSSRSCAQDRPPPTARPPPMNRDPSPITHHPPSIVDNPSPPPAPPNARHPHHPPRTSRRS